MDSGTDKTGPREASAEIRQAAAQLRGYYLALISEGFSKTETLQIIGHTFVATAGQGGSG